MLLVFYLYLRLHIYSGFCFCFFSPQVLEVELRTLHLLGKRDILLEPLHQLFLRYLFIYLFIFGSIGV
jgi:hypothetical protein